MAQIVRTLAVAFLPLGLACGAAAMSDGGSAQTSAKAAPPARCEIRIVRLGNNIELEGLVYSATALSGSYRLRVSQAGPGGSADISQGGEFTALPGKASSLGSVSLPVAGNYSATLRLRWNGGTVDCHAGTQGLRRTLNPGETL